jgi:hypothetical protein
LGPESDAPARLALPRESPLSGPKAVRHVLKSVPDLHIEEVRLTAEVEGLADHYISSGVIPESNRADARHIAIATVHKVTVLVSWHFKHIVNLGRDVDEQLRGKTFDEQRRYLDQQAALRAKKATAEGKEQAG